MIEVGINITQPDYAFTNWQYTLIMFAIIAITIVFNTWGAQSLPMLETLSLFGHVAGFILFLGIFWGMCPRNSSYEVFVNVVNSGGWSNTGTACLISQATVMYCNLGT